MGSTYHHDYEAFRANVLKADWMLEEMLVRAERVLVRAETTAPFDIQDEDGTHYRDCFVLSGGFREDRAYGRVSNTDMPTALFVEYGTVNTPRTAPSATRSTRQAADMSKCTALRKMKTLRRRAESQAQFRSSSVHARDKRQGHRRHEAVTLSRTPAIGTDRRQALHRLPAPQTFYERATP
jgi:hypothetical protein